MALNYGKAFEQRFKEDFLKSVPNSTIDRLYDVTTGFKAISQVSDFIGYSMPLIFYLECKSIRGNTFPIGNLTQYNKLLSKVGIPGVRTGAIIWYWEKDIIIYVPVSTFKKMIEEGKKSVNIKTDLESYIIYKIPCQKKRVFCTGDYSILLQTQEGE